MRKAQSANELPLPRPDPRRRNKTMPVHQAEDTRANTCVLELPEATVPELPFTSSGVPLLARLFEIVVAATVLILMSPVMLVIAWIIRRGTPGPALFKQQRVGRNFKPFALYKYRTLYADAKERF